MAKVIFDERLTLSEPEAKFTDATQCRACNGSKTHFLGRLPDSRDFAGQQTALKLAGGALWRCGICQFVFRSPILPEAEYDRLYASGTLDLWDVESIPREDFRLIREYLHIHAGKPLKVLDVGCYTGQLLKSLPGSFSLFGIEPNQEAANVARNSGITIIAPACDDANLADGPFDIIVLCDVIEHVARPGDVLKQLRQNLVPGGLLILSTGNSDAWLWKLTKARFWYCHFPEHISFLGERWLKNVPQTIQFDLKKLIRFNYRGTGINLLKLGAALVYWISPELYRKLRRLVSRAERPSSIPTPGIGATRDHVMCVLEAV